MPSKFKKRALRGALLGALALLLYFLPPLPQEFLDLRRDSSVTLTDRHGVPLRRNLSVRDGVNVWVPLGEMPEVLLQAALKAEDKRFYLHPGVDPLAMARAVRDNLRAGAVVSGASTITQQLLRTLRPQEERSWSAKLNEAYWSTRLEWRYGKDELLEAYLNRVAFGPSVYGVEEASRFYFDKPVSALSPAEAVALAVTIRSPSVLNPFASGESQELRTWSEPVIRALEHGGHLSPEAAHRARHQELELSLNAPPFQAPHFCDLVQEQLAQRRGPVTTTLDLELQQTVEGLVKTHLALLADHKVGNAAVVVAEVSSGQVVALVGSRDYQKAQDGQFNAALSLRQPGSTLKPFTYGLLLEKVGHGGFILPDLNLYEDAELESFVPKNYDEHFHGPVSMRTALACSYNVPAVRALERVGVENLLEELRRLGFSNLDQPPEHYGLGLTLGDGSVSLFQLVAAYRALARGGLYSPLSLFTDSPPPHSMAVFDPKVCYLLTDILQDDQARLPSFGTPNALEFPFPVAVKTGTSKGYRDNWTIGYTPRHVVGVWVGNSDGSPMQDVSGITGAGPLFRDIVLALGSGGDFERPPGLTQRTVCTLSGQTVGKKCPSYVAEWDTGAAETTACEVCSEEEGRLVFDFPSLYRPWAQEKGLALKKKTKGVQNDSLRFVFPLSQEVFLLDPDLRRDFQRVKFRIAGGKPPYRWSVDGREAQETQATSLWWELVPGNHKVKVTDASGTVKEIRLTVVGQKPPG